MSFLFTINLYSFSLLQLDGSYEFFTGNWKCEVLIRNGFWNHIKGSFPRIMREHCLRMNERLITFACRTLEEQLLSYLFHTRLFVGFASLHLVSLQSQFQAICRVYLFENLFFGWRLTRLTHLKQNTTAPRS